MFYHYSWVRPVEKIRQKLAYYSFQSGNTQAESYVDNVFLKWRTDPESVEGMTHPMKGGKTESFKGVHPHGVQKLIDEARSALMSFDVNRAKRVYLETMRNYNELPDNQKTKVYEDVRELYDERKSAERLLSGGLRQ